MKTATVRLNLPLNPSSDATAVEVDGVDLRNATRGVTVRAEVGKLTAVTLDLAWVEAEVDGEAVVLLPQPTKDALVALGWTPPEEPVAVEGESGEGEQDTT